MKLLIVPDGMSLQKAYELQQTSLLGLVEVNENMSHGEIAKFLKVIKNNSKGGKVYGVLNDEAIPIEEIHFIKEYLNQKNTKKSRMFLKKEKPENSKTSNEQATQENSAQPLYGGDGLSVNSPAIINCSSMPMAKFIVDNYISKVCGDRWVRGMEATIQNPNDPGKRLRRIHVKKPSGEETLFFFDFSQPLSGVLDGGESPALQRNHGYYSTPRDSQPPNGKSCFGSILLWLLVLGLVGGGIGWLATQQHPPALGNHQSGNNTKKQNNDPLESQPKLNQAKKEKALPPELPMPGTGLLELHSNEERIGPLEIKTSQGANYFVKLVSVHSQTAVMTMFIRGGEIINTDVPIGVYEIRYASGEKWYGYKHLFGSETVYTKADKTLSFEINGNQISGYGITLYRVVNGNLRTTIIKPSEF